MSDESTMSSSPTSSANSTGTLTASSSGKGETATEGESDFYPDLDARGSGYSLESTAAPALTTPVLNTKPPNATTQVPETVDIPPTNIRTLAELRERLMQVPADRLVVLYFQSDSVTTRLLGHALAGLKNTFGLEVIKLDLQQHYEISSYYNITQTPTFVFIKNSEKLEQFSGADVKKLKSVINPLTMGK